MAKPTLYHLQDSRSFRCEWLLQELGAEHELVYSKRHANRAAEEFRTAHAMGKAPMLVLEDGKTIITESGAICEYIIDVYATQEQKAQFYAGNDPSQRARVRSWSYFAEGTLLTHAISITYSRWFLPEEYKAALPAMETKLAPNVNNDLKYVEATLASNASGFLVGDHLTLADIMLAFSVHFVLARGLGAKWEDDAYPKTKEWIRRLQKREAWIAATKQGEDSYLLDSIAN